MPRKIIQVIRKMPTTNGGDMSVIKCYTCSSAAHLTPSAIKFKHYYCLSCRRKTLEKWRMKNKDYIKIYGVEYRKKNSLKLLETYKNNYSTDKQRAIRAKNPGKYKARYKLQNAIKSGKIKRMPCSVCNNSPTHAHHLDYRSPFKVVWLCKGHHFQEHNKELYGLVNAIRNK